MDVLDMAIYFHIDCRSKSLLCLENQCTSPDSFQSHTPGDCWVRPYPISASSILSHLSTATDRRGCASYLRAKPPWQSLLWGWTRYHFLSGLARTPGGPREKTAVPVTDWPELPSRSCRKLPPPPRSTCPSHSGSIFARLPSNRGNNCLRSSCLVNFNIIWLVNEHAHSICTIIVIFIGSNLKIIESCLTSQLRELTLHICFTCYIRTRWSLTLTYVLFNYRTPLSSKKIIFNSSNAEKSSSTILFFSFSFFLGIRFFLHSSFWLSSVLFSWASLVIRTLWATVEVLFLPNFW